MIHFPVDPSFHAAISHCGQLEETNTYTTNTKNKSNVFLVHTHTYKNTNTQVNSNVHAWQSAWELV